MLSVTTYFIRRIVTYPLDRAYPLFEELRPAIRKLQLCFPFLTGAWLVAGKERDELANKCFHAITSPMRRTETNQPSL